MNGKVRKGRKMRKRLIIGMRGASGAPLTIELLKQLQQMQKQTAVQILIILQRILLSSFLLMQAAEMISWHV